MAEFAFLETETLVLLLAAGLYLTDLGQLLRVNEVLFVRGTGGTWSAVTPRSGFLFNRRYAVFPRFLDPGSTVLRLRWPADGGDTPLESLKAEIEAKLRSFRALRIVCIALFVEIFVGVPLFYALPDYRWPLLVVLLLIYLQVLALVAWLFLKRRELAFGWKDSIALAFECLVCLPYAINFHRKVAARAVRGSGLDVVRAGELLLPPEKQSRLLDHLRGALDDWLDRTPDDTAISTRLGELRERLQQENSP